MASASAASRRPLLSGEDDTTSPSAPVYADMQNARPFRSDDIKERFKTTIGMIPFMEPNIKEDKDMEQFITLCGPIEKCSSCSDGLGVCFCCMIPVVGCCYVLSRNVLVNAGDLAFTLNNGKPELLLPGRHVLLSPLNHFEGMFSKGDDVIHVGPITIVRISEGKVGLAWNNADPEILLPGLHMRNNAAFKFVQTESIDKDLIQFGPIKFLTVRSGGVRVCFANGKVQIFTEGRYAINSGTFVVAGHINTQQTNIRFDKHPVLLDGGINLLVEGLLTYQVVDVEKLIHELGDANLERTIKDVTKAELARVFAGLHLEQISQASTQFGTDTELKQMLAAGSSGAGTAPAVADQKQRAPIPPQVPTHTLQLDEKEPDSVLGQQQALHHESPTSAEGETRMWICNQVVKAITPLCAAWGVKVKNFQLESTNIADVKYAAEYEAASLAMAKAKADLRAVYAQNKIVLATAQAKAQALRIEAEGKKTAAVIEAEGVAEARRIDARARNEAAQTMTEPFAQSFAMKGQQVEFAKALKASVLTVVPESAIGATVLSQSLLKSSGDA